MNPSLVFLLSVQTDLTKQRNENETGKRKRKKKQKTSETSLIVHWFRSAPPREHQSDQDPSFHRYYEQIINDCRSFDREDFLSRPYFQSSSQNKKNR